MLRESRMVQEHFLQNELDPVPHYRV